MIQKVITLISLLHLITPTHQSTCEWIGGSYGAKLSCLPGWVATGICGSGMNADCNIPDSRTTKSLSKTSYYFMIQCCQTKYQNNFQSNCLDQGINNGQLIPCVNNQGKNQAIYGGCGSGRKDDCTIEGDPRRTKYTAVETCCDNLDISVGPNENCGWRYNSFGDLVTCPGGYVAAGYCGSGRTGECEGGGKNAFTGVYCCPFVDVDTTSDLSEESSSIVSV